MVKLIVIQLIKMASLTNCSSTGHLPRVVGQRTRADGQRTRADGQRTRADGQRTRAVGQRTRGVGQRTRGVGQRTRGDGQRTRGVGQRTRTWRSTVVWLVLACGLVVDASAYDPRLDHVMFFDPELPAIQTRFVFSDHLKPLWLSALQRPEAELQRMSADTFVMARQMGMTDLADTADHLIALLRADHQDSTVRRAAANALVVLDVQRAAELLANETSRGQLDVARIIEPALARWDYRPIRETWLARLADPRTERLRLLLAIDGLGSVREDRAAPPLLQLLSDTNVQFPTRLAAARALSQMDSPEVVPTAARFTTSMKSDEGLLAVTLLGSRQDAESIGVLKSLAKHPSPAVAGLALRRLFTVAAHHVDEFATDALRSTDVKVRQVAAESLVARKDVASIELLAELVNDNNPSLRRYVSSSLVELAQHAPLREATTSEMMRILASDAWRGLEQSVIVLATLDHEPAASRLVELLEHRRPEVSVTAAWGLRRLGVSETLPAMLAQAERQTERVVAESVESIRLESVDLQLCHLFQAFGEHNYREADALLRRYVPKEILYLGMARPAAVWALGKLHQDQTPPELVKAFIARLTDQSVIQPEQEDVQRMSAIGLGRLRAETELPTLRSYVIEAPSQRGLACIWAIHLLTGENFEVSMEREVGSSDWFLYPRHREKPSNGHEITSSNPM